VHPWLTAVISPILLMGCGAEFVVSTTSENGDGGRGGSSSSTSTSTSANVGGQAGAAGAGGGVANDSGCSDGSREEFIDVLGEPNIAGCSGAFGVPGTTTVDSMLPQCSRNAGNDGATPAGTGCSIEDLCALGWHVCRSAAEVAHKSSTGQCPTQPVANTFWLTRQAQNTNLVCDEYGVNNLIGCGTGIGTTVPNPCPPLNRRMAVSSCASTATWYCGDSSHAWSESQVVIKNGLTEGGVLCCRNE